jgi:hypothetical protein
VQRKHHHHPTDVGSRPPGESGFGLSWGLQLQRCIGTTSLRQLISRNLQKTFMSNNGKAMDGFLAVSFLCPPYSSAPIPNFLIARGGAVKSWEESYRKAAELVGKMTLLEKVGPISTILQIDGALTRCQVNITTGVGWQQGLCVGNTAPAVNVGFPSLCLQDGPLGLRFADHATAWPAALTVGATWNRELAFKRGVQHGEEARKKGVNVILGPSMGPLGKLPAGGRYASPDVSFPLLLTSIYRNWEGFGTDPYLQGLAAAETIKGIQSSGVIATAKHFILKYASQSKTLMLLLTDTVNKNTSGKFSNGPRVQTMPSQVTLTIELCMSSISGRSQTLSEQELLL